MATLIINPYDRALDDGLTIYEERVCFWPNYAGSVAYVPLEPNPLGFKARLIIANSDNGLVEITNYKSRASCLMEFADYSDNEALFTEASKLFTMEGANNG